MAYQGEERRQAQTSFCNQHIEFVTALTDLTGEIKHIGKQLEDGVTFRRGVVMALIGIVLTIFVQFGSFCYFFGQSSRQITVNTSRLDVIEEIIRK